MRSMPTVQHLVMTGLQLQAAAEPLSACVQIAQQGAHPLRGLDCLPGEMDTH